MHSEFLRIFKYFAVWRVVLFLTAAASVYLIPQFGARFPYYDRVLEITNLPNWIWGFGNFDGVHYLKIAQDGYTANYSQAFFPLFPLLVRLLALVVPKHATLNTALYVDPAYFWSGLILSNFFFILSLLVFYKLLRLDFNNKWSFKTVILLLTFPLAFYFGAIYTESLFLLLLVSTLYLLRRKKFLKAGVLIGLATATRVFGVLLILVYLIEVLKNKNFNIKSLFGMMVSPLGLLGYMYYLKLNFGDALYFLTSQPVFGAERSTNIVLLPQVFYRYIRIFFSQEVLSYSFFNAFLEFAFTLIPLILIILLYKKMRLSYFVFSLTGLLLPTLTGTLSSMPRYSLVAFLVLPFVVERFGRYYKLLVLIFTLIQVILLSLFIRGYWVA